MKRVFGFIFALLVIVPVAMAHRLDEYLQATTVLVERDHVVIVMRLTPGVDVAGRVLKEMDSDGDGVISPREQKEYAERVRNDLTVSVDGEALALRLTSGKFAGVDEMKEGLGDVLLTFTAPVKRGAEKRKLVLENRHWRGIGAYLVNCLVPEDPEIHVVAQTRNYEQSVYQLDYVQSEPVKASAGHVDVGWLACAGMLLSVGRLIVWRLSSGRTLESEDTLSLTLPRRGRGPE